jgi:hypothetical protein
VLWIGEKTFLEKEKQDGVPGAVLVIACHGGTAKRKSHAEDNALPEAEVFCHE